MARTKQDSSTGFQKGNANGSARRRPSVTEITGTIEKRLEEVAESAARDPVEQRQSGLLALGICVGGIYASL